MTLNAPDDRPIDQPRLSPANRAAVDVSVVIVNYRTPDHVIACLAALARERDDGTEFDVMVVDGGSGDGSAGRLAAAISQERYRGWVDLLALECNGGFGWANNQAIRRLAMRPCPPQFVHLLNPDAVPQPGAVRLLAQALDAVPRAAAAGSLLTAANGRPQGSAFNFLTVRSEFVRGSGVAGLARLLRSHVLVESSTTIASEWVTGASVMMRLRALDDVGLFDEGFFLYFEEVELMHRFAAAGWLALHVPESRVMHIGGASTGIVDGASREGPPPAYWYRSRRRYFARTGGRWAVAAASLAWLAGVVVAGLWHVLGLSRGRVQAPREVREFLRHGMVASREDLAAAVPALESPVDRPPAWMVWQNSTGPTAPPSSAAPAA